MAGMQTEHGEEIVDGIRISSEMIEAGHRAFHENYWCDDHPVEAVTAAYAAMETVRRRGLFLHRLLGACAVVLQNLRFQDERPR